MAETINVGILRAQLTADTAQFSMGLRGAQDALSAFEGRTKQYADGIAKGMSQAGKAATDSARMIAGMGAAGRESLAEIEQTMAQTAQAGSRAGQAIAAAVGILGTLNIGAKAAEAAQATSRIQDAAERMKIGTDAVQRLAFAAEQSGSSLEGVATAMGRMAETLGSNSADEKLNAIGLSLEQLKGLSPDQTFVAIADAIQKMPDPLKQADAATDLFGRSAQQLLPAIRAGFTQVGEAAPVMAASVIEAGDHVGDNLHEIELRMNNLKAQALLPLMEFFTTNLPQGVQVGIAAVASFTPSLEQLALGVIALGGPSGAWASLVAMGGTVAAFFTTTLPGAFAAFFSSAAVASVVTFFTTTLPAALGAVAAFLGPQGLIALALLALAGIWYVWGEDIKRISGEVWSWVSERFTMLLEHAKTTWHSIVEHTTSFFTGLASILKRIPAELLTPLLGPIGLVLTTFQKWPDIVKIAQAVYTGVKTWLVDKFNAIVDSIKQKVKAVTGFFSDMYDAVVGNSFVPDMVEGIGREFSKLGAVMVAPAESGVSRVSQAFNSMRGMVLDVVNDMLRRVSSALSGWLDGFMPSWAAKLLGGFADAGMQAGANFLAGLGGRGGGLLGGFAGGGAGMGSGGGLLGGLLGGIFGGGANASQAAVLAGNSGIAGAMGGGAGAAGGGGLMGSMGAFFTNPWTIGIGAALAGGIALWRSGFGRGGEEGTQVNPARDQFFGEFQSQFGGSQFEALAQAFHQAGVSGDIAERLIKSLYDADSMDEFRAATEAIRQSLATAGSAVATADSALTQLTTTVDHLDRSTSVSDGAINGLRTQLDILSGTASPEVIALVNTQLTELIASGTATDETVAALTETVIDFHSGAKIADRVVTDTTTAIAGMAKASDRLETQTDYTAAAMLGLTGCILRGEDAAGAFGGALDQLRSKLSQPIDIELNINRGDGSGGGSGGGGGGGDVEQRSKVPSFANEGIVSRPTMAWVGDAMEPEWILHQSSVMDLIRRAASFGASAMGAASVGLGDVDAIRPRVSRAGGDAIYLTANIEMNGVNNPMEFSRVLPSALKAAIRHDHSVTRTIRMAAGKA